MPARCATAAVGVAFDPAAGPSLISQHADTPATSMSGPAISDRTLAEVLNRVSIAALLLMLALVVATLVNRRDARPRAPAHRAPAHRAYDYPRQLTRSDFARPDAPWLVVVFSSESCEGCPTVVDKAMVLASEDIAVSECEFSKHRVLHERYAIAGVPTTVIADSDGVVRRGFVGSLTAADLWAALADLRASPHNLEEH